MNLKSRVERLEAAAAPVVLPRLLVTFVPCDPERRANGIQRIHFGGQTWLRQPGEAEGDFEARVRAVLAPVDVDPPRTGMAAVYAFSTLTADYGDSDG